MGRKFEDVRERVNSDGISEEQAAEMGMPEAINLASAISLKRIGTALERIADVLERREDRESRA